MRVRGRYTARYREFEQREPTLPRVQNNVRIVDNHSLLDIANAQFRNVRVSCWPSPEGIERADGGRRWGKLGSTDTAAVIVPFRTKAVGVSTTVRINTFQLEIFLCVAGEETGGPMPYPKSCCRSQQCATHADICLLELPAPRDVSRPQSSTSTPDEVKKKPWQFRSEAVASCDGRARAAQWTWDANGHEPIDLHGGVILQHSGQPFILACRVQGKASIEIPDSRIRVRVRFGNEQYGPQWWKMMPRDSDEDLIPLVQQFENVMQDLNTERAARNRMPSISDLQYPGGHNFGHPNVNDGNVIMGNVLGNVFYSTPARRSELDAYGARRGSPIPL